MRVKQDYLHNRNSEVLLFKWHFLFMGKFKICAYACENWKEWIIYCAGDGYLEKEFLWKKIYIKLYINKEKTRL